MAHNLATINGRTAMFYAAPRGKPWHGLGQATNDTVYWREAMELAGLNWQVEKQFLFDKDGKQTSAHGIFRDGQVFLGTVGDRYVPIQNAVAFNFIDTLLEAENGSHYETAGALGNGEKIWCLARIPYDFNVIGKDPHETYLLAVSSHDGSSGLIVKICTTRVVCQNTVNIALSENSTNLNIRHTQSASIRMAEAIELMKGVKQSVASLKEKLELLATRKVNSEIANKVMDKVFGKDWKDSTRKQNQAREIAQLFEYNDGDAIKEIRGTGYNLFNAFTEYSDHYRSVKVTESRGAMSQSQIRKEGALFEYDNWKDKVLDSILNEVSSAPSIDTTPINNILNMVAV
jgi:phage/plasmid-like protein (TIGR03299 family)